jgi:hypothetical protein
MCMLYIRKYSIICVKGSAVWSLLIVVETCTQMGWVCFQNSFFLSFEHFIDIDIYLLQIQLYCFKANCPCITLYRVRNCC